ncbi:Ig-like domain-containing domain [Bacteroides mediterraneensis]|uniref:Ig-like domain-containing protein n=1 Tax=Bacteroides mediterraneensis TaxID=1841856 RepID=A0ABS2EVY3_9BACE|nr:Ig-like domain-containing domain [Bacteroides mediterraneensis]MBM6758399.1 Ig-like domain-containing protein [Bacteroides mediterraneensis]MBM6780671.1 Ig-like domain-containing protein [Bacteroides mediterraneensis]
MRPIPKYVAFLLVIIGFYACASTGMPDGGPYDETPPKFVRANPEPNATNNKRKKISIEFDEYIKLDNPSEKVIISPPQKEAPEVKVSGHRVLVEFFDTLRENTTYTVDFGDAIVDNNEDNPLGNFAYAFSTGAHIDTMEVSGTILNAENLEPVKGIQVGLHQNLEDSAFVKLPFDRISRTDSRGHFTIRGVAPGKYRIYALMDGNQNYLFDSKTEAIAFQDSLVIPDMRQAVRQDTVWNELDTLAYDTIYEVHYTRFLPDNLVLRSFKEENSMQYLVKSEREQLNRFSLYFSAKADTLPTIKGLDFDEKNAFVIESNPRNDTIRYWIKDTVMCERDTLTFQMDYLATDTLGQLVPKTDTLRMVNKIDKKRRMALAEEAMKKEEKERKKRAKKGDTLKVEPKFFAMSVDAPSSLDLNRNIVLKFDEPVEHIDTAAIHMAVKVDSLWNTIPFILMKDSIVPRQYQILADWQPGQEYQLKIDSLGIKGIYGLYTDKVEKELKVKTLEEYGTLYLNIVGAGPHAIVQLLNSSDGVVRQQPVTDKNTCDFYFLQPSTKYYIRLFNDDNNNGVWDTGNYEEKRQPEEVFYFPKVWEMKANFEFEETWDVHAVPLDKQKLDEIKKQKPDEAKKIKDRNKERARKLGKT